MKSRAQLLWLIPVIALVAIAGGVYWFVVRPDVADNTTAENRATTGKVPDLGSRGYPVIASNMEPEPEDDVETDGGPTDGGEVEPEPEAANSAREIDIWLSNLAIATKAGDRKGIALNHEMLAKAEPDTLVDERVRNALDNEESAWVRIQFFAAYHEAKPRFDWAMHVYDTRTAKFMGTDDLYVGGETEELRLIAKELYAALIQSWMAAESGDSRLMALLRSVLDTEKPDWLLEQSVNQVMGTMIAEHMVSFARALEQELRSFLLRRRAERTLREGVFGAFILTFDPHDSIFAELELSEWWDYTPVLALLYEPRRKLINEEGLLLRSVGTLGWLNDLANNPELPKLLDRLLQGSMPTEDKRLLIQRLAEREVTNGRSMIEAGLARKDANYSDYLTSFGSYAETGEELQRLTAAADEPDVAAAQGAIEGLRQSSLPEADVELRKVLEEGANPGVKSQALGALLSRSESTDKLLEEYLGESKDASLRAVAAQHVPLTNVERLQRIVEEDPSPTVRLAALNRVGSIMPDGVIQHKELYGWFVKMKDRDNSAVIRAAARKYAEALAESLKE
jgi:hypothetical protein